MSERLPHDDYTAAVVEALAALGCEPANWWTETPDGQQLDAVIDFHARISPDAWPDGVFLGWDQREGWSLTGTGENRNLYPLGLDTYANPAAVARRTLDRLLDEPDKAVDEQWDGAVALQDAVEAWEVNSQ